MINIFFLSLPSLLYDVGFFWHSLFLAMAVCRYNFNKSMLMLNIGLVGVIVCGSLPFLWKWLAPVSWNGVSIKIIFGLQIILGLTSIAYSIKNKIWKNDILFTLMEPIYIVFFAGYMIQGGFKLNIVPQIYSWIIVYISLQALLLLIKLMVGIKLSVITGSLKKKLKIIMYVLPRLDASFGLNDLELLNPSISRLVQPTSEEIIAKEVELLKEKTLALIKDDYPEYKNLRKENDQYDSRYLRDLN